MKIIQKLSFAELLVLLLLGVVGCGTTFSLNASGQYTNPSWAPPYSDGVRYYYLPEIETYYDLSNNDFI